MRLAILSDVHGNLEALLAVERALGELGVDEVVCLGDVVGYGASPTACCERVRRMASVVLLGNHDAAVSGRMDYRYYYEAARDALDWTARNLDPDQAAWLAGLPYTHAAGEAGFSHGSPRAPERFEYVLAAEQAAELAEDWARLARVSFVGHTHLCRAFALDATGEVEDLVPRRVQVDPQRKLVLSVGSVGQPRDADERAGFVVYDTDAGTVTWHRVPYDVFAAARRIYEARLPKSFARRLFLGV